MTLATTIQDRTNDGTSIVEFLVAVMRNELDDFKPCHRLDAAKLLVKYDKDEARNYIIDNPREPSQPRLNSSSPNDSYFDQKLAQVIQESTDDGRKVCRFLINVMDGALSTFKPHHRISAARELLSRGFGKHATPRRSSEGTSPRTAIRGRNPEYGLQLATGRSTPSPLTGEGWGEGEIQDHQPTPTHTTQPSPQPTKSEKSPNPTNQSSDQNEIPWDQINAIIDAAKEESDRIMAEQGIDPDNPPYKRDLSSYDQAWENTQKWFEEWKNSLDPEEYEAIISREAAEFDASLELRLKRRKQIAEDRELREKEEAERESAEAEKAEAETAAKESDEESEPGPPTRSQHKPKLMFTLGNSMYIECGHPDCKLHDEDRNRWQGSVQYGAGPTSGHFP